MDYSILINKNNKIKDNYLEKINLVTANDIDNNEVKVEEETYKAYLKLKEFLSEKNIEIGIASSYRSIEEQNQIFNDFIETYGEEYAKKYAAIPAYSEHHTGLAIDIIIKIDNKFIDDNEYIFNNVEKYEIIHKYFKDFGFILRYPKGKEHITGYSYEPWHIRYTGKFIANIIEENKLSLEEYKQTFSGVLVLNKKKGYTSFDLVNRVSKLFGIKKVGHTGTLDPLAEGVLVICIGQATKIVELLTAKDKEYIAQAKLGIKTDTYDIDGTVTEENIIKDNIDIKEILSTYKKTYLQEVPIYSAVKVKGKKLYEYARSKKDVTLPKKEVTIKEIELLSQKEDTFTFKTLVTKGCYIRSLINDIGEDIGCGAVMTSLIRTKQGNIKIEEAYTIEDVEQGNYKLYKIEELLDYPQVVVDDELEFKIKNGVKVPNNWNIKNRVIFKNRNNKLLGVYEIDNKKLRVWKNFN